MRINQCGWLPTLLLAGLVLIAGPGCKRQEYSNSFTTPVRAIGDTRVRLTDGRGVTIPNAGRAGATMLVLVRHAEKMDGDDPPLTEAGEQRALRLAAILQGLDLQEVYASPYVRTRQTAKPVADAKGLKVTPYDPTRLQDFLDLVLLRDKDKRVLIVGHSNTTPALLNFLVGREAYEQIADSDYDNIYVATVDRKGRTSVLSLRFRAE